MNEYFRTDHFVQWINDKKLIQGYLEGVSEEGQNFEKWPGLSLFSGCFHPSCLDVTNLYYGTANVQDTTYSTFKYVAMLAKTLTFCIELCTRLQKLP